MKSLENNSLFSKNNPDLSNADKNHKTNNLQYKKHENNNSELDLNFQTNKINKTPEYIERIQQVYYLERWCRL